MEIISITSRVPLIQEFLKDRNKLLKEIILINVFFLSVFVSHIPDNNGKFIHIKAIPTFVLFLLNLFYIFSDSQLKEKIFSKKLVNVFWLWISFLIFILGTISYSINPNYAFQKYYGLVFDITPLIFAAYFLNVTWNKYRFGILVSSLLIAGLLLTLALLINGPFVYPTKSFLGWSHVGFGRFISYIFILNVILLFNSKQKIHYLILSILLAVISFGLFISGLRAAILISFFLFGCLFVWEIFKKQLTIKKILFLIVPIIISVISLLIFKTVYSETLKRFDRFVENRDGAVETRKQAYIISFEMFKESPIVGKGFGSFNSILNGPVAQGIEYPHNILLEVISETGIIGLLILLVLLYRSFKNAYKINIQLIFFLVISFGLAFTSGNITDQKILFLGLALNDYHVS